MNVLMGLWISTKTSRCHGQLSKYGTLSVASTSSKYGILSVDSTSSKENTDNIDNNRAINKFNSCQFAQSVYVVAVVLVGVVVVSSRSSW